MSDPREIFLDSDDYWLAVEFEGWPVMDPDPWRDDEPTTQPTEPPKP